MLKIFKDPAYEQIARDIIEIVLKFPHVKLKTWVYNGNIGNVIHHIAKDYQQQMGSKMMDELIKRQNEKDKDIHLGPFLEDSLEISAPRNRKYKHMVFFRPAYYHDYAWNADHYFLQHVTKGGNGQRDNGRVTLELNSPECEGCKKDCLQCSMKLAAALKTAHEYWENKCAGAASKQDYIKYLLKLENSKDQRDR